MGVGEGEMGEEGGSDHVTLDHRTTHDTITNANSIAVHVLTVPELQDHHSDPKTSTRASTSIMHQPTKTLLHPKTLHPKIQMALPTTPQLLHVSKINVTNALRIIALFLAHLMGMQMQPRMALQPPSANAHILLPPRRSTSQVTYHMNWPYNTTFIIKV